MPRPSAAPGRVAGRASTAAGLAAVAALWAARRVGAPAPVGRPAAPVASLPRPGPHGPALAGTALLAPRHRGEGRSAVPEARESLRPLRSRLAALRSPPRTPPARSRRGGCAPAVADRSGVRRSWSTRAAGNSVRCALCASLTLLAATARALRCAPITNRPAHSLWLGRLSCAASPGALRAKSRAKSTLLGERWRSGY